jgi:hypothetical protein
MFRASLGKTAKPRLGPGGMAEAVEHLPCKHKSLSSNPNLTNLPHTKKLKFG